MLEELAIGVIANGLAAGAGYSGAAVKDKIGDTTIKDTIAKVLRREPFSEQIDEQLSSALQRAVPEAIETADIDAISGEEFLENWSDISKHLEEIDVDFENEREAAVRITEAIERGIKVDFDANPQAEMAIQEGVLDAYSDVVRGFAEDIDADLAKVLETEADIELTSAVYRLEDQMAAIQRQFHQEEDARLRDQGFVRLDSLYFDRQELGDPITAWQTGFDIKKVAAGYPLERTIAVNGDRRPFAATLIQRLRQGEDIVVVGGPGSGKSTVLKSVACRWYRQDDGVVFYRESATATMFDSPGTLLRAIRNAESDVLIVVEDAANQDTSALYEVMQELVDNETVSVLLDSRQTEWSGAENLLRDARLESLRSSITEVPVPDIDRKECETAVEKFEELTDLEVPINGEELYAEVKNADIGAPLFLAYQLTRSATLDQDDTPSTTSAFEQDVINAYTKLKEVAADKRLPFEVGVLVNVLNAAQLPINPELVHGLATNVEDHRSVDQTLQNIRGSIIHQQDATGYQAPHYTWSVLFLERLLEDRGNPGAIDLFETCVNAILNVIEDETRREELVHEWLREKPELFERLNQGYQQEISDRYALHIFKISYSEPDLAPLFGSHKSSKIEIPAICSERTKMICKYYHLNVQTTPNTSSDSDDADADETTSVRSYSDFIEQIRRDRIISQPNYYDIPERESPLIRSGPNNNEGQTTQQRPNIDIFTDAIDENARLQSADALVSPADTEFTMSGGLAGAIKDASDEGIQQAARVAAPQDIEPGDVVVTGPHWIAKYVIHAVTRRLGKKSDEQIIQTATRNTLTIADDLGCKTIVMTPLGCGFGGVDIKRGVRVILKEVLEYDPTTLENVRLMINSVTSYEKAKEVEAEIKRHDS